MFCVLRTGIVEKTNNKRCFFYVGTHTMAAWKNETLFDALADLQNLDTVNNDSAFVAVRRRRVHCNKML